MIKKDKRGGVLIGDVVGLGKTLMATLQAIVKPQAGQEGRVAPGSHRSTSVQAISLVAPISAR